MRGGIECLLLSCSGPEQRQFSGVRRLMAELAADYRRVEFLEWRGGGLDLRRRRRLLRVLVSGHGLREAAGFQDTEGSGGPGLTPGGLRLPGRALLFLLGCHQGGELFRRAWAAGCGIPVEQVRGCGGETESALSTCLLLHLLEDGPESLERWFVEWERCNQALEPLFPAMRAAYAACGGDPLAVLAGLQGNEALRPFAGFLAAVARHPDYLTGLA